MSQHTVAIEVANRKLKVACPVGQESALLSAAKEVGDRLSQASQKNKANNTPELAMLMTALNLAYELLDTQEKLAAEKKEAQEKISLLQSTIEQALNSQQNLLQDKQA